MSNQLFLVQFQNHLNESISTGTFLKVSLGNYQGNDKELKNVYVRRVKIKRVDMLSFTYRNKTRDIIKNLSIVDGMRLVGQFISNDFRIATLFTTGKEVILEYNKKGVISLRERLLNTRPVPVPLASHDKEKKRVIEAVGSKSYLQALNITDATGVVYKNAQSKYKQINQYIELLSPMIKGLPAGSIRNVADMGSGKGYLTFALYDYLHQVLGLDVDVVGVEYREDLVLLCNEISKSSDFKKLSFVPGTIEDFDASGTDLLIALHACDTATDDAIFKGITAGAKLIVVAPCCHKQIRREMVSASAKNELDFVLKYGIFMERQAEMVTDGIRALILEYYGYKTKVMEFISDVHTPKNVLIVGVKANPAADLDLNGKQILKKIKEAKDFFGISYHHLEKLFKL
ncbi:SAM-dependent methyltransferase [Pedobacter sp. MC2016-14]|uniref:class I SAM-dependent methyltransferase n=1 Tax=Pedobacter sp. MC2016-14 TaxID=2897327 RepID=UPI001E59AD0D|nr:SAM-dependent methyltransferase [Pedobacter sp. MC2016-14]MCD0488025.1 SAM-dependent methyltransferase [Pedobacter sp. MC2016-14]